MIKMYLFLWCWDYVENSKTLFLFNKYGSYRKSFINKIILFFNFTVISKNLFQIGPLVTETQNLWKKICSILHDAYLFKNYCECSKKLVSKIVLFFDFTYVNQMLCNYIYWVKVCQSSIYSPPLPPPLHGTSKRQGLNISRGAIFFLNKQPKTNISAKLDTFIRDVIPPTFGRYSGWLWGHPGALWAYSRT